MGAARHLLFVFLLVSLAAPAGARSPQDPESTVVLARWRAEAFGSASGGVCCWLEAADGALRFELAEAAEPAAATTAAAMLFSWRGVGWTAVLGEPGQGTLGAWREKWDVPSPELSAWLRAIVAACPAGAGRECRRELPPIRSLTLVPDQKERETTFRSRMTRRGRGRGGRNEILTIRFLEGNGSGVWAAGSRARITGSRRPGSLELEVLARQDVIGLPAEAYLPLWPLDAFPAIEAIFPGTPETTVGYHHAAGPMNSRLE